MEGDHLSKVCVWCDCTFVGRCDSDHSRALAFSDLSEGCYEELVYMSLLEPGQSVAQMV